MASMEPQDLARAEQRHPTWELALLYPDQGCWSQEDYFALDVGRHVEYNAGYLEFQPMPDALHQAIVLFLVNALRALHRAGRALMAPFPVRLAEQKFREPDVVFMLGSHAHRQHDTYWDGADLVMEVVSDSNRKHDLVTKRAEYERAGIAEYWIVDPAQGSIAVLAIEAGAYQVCGQYVAGQTARSKLLEGLAISVDEVLAAQ